jgi:molybdopterin-guanine dinucleotide biosynthesis protein MobB
VIGVSGYSGSGKTLLLERMVPRLCARGLRVAVIKDAGHAVEVDRPGKDSDRLFRAGADVLLNATNEVFMRRQQAALSLPHCLRLLPGGYDLVLVEGFRDEAIPQIRLGGSRGDHTLLALAEAGEGVEVAEEAVWALLARTHAALPVLAYAPESGPVGARSGEEPRPEGGGPAPTGGVSEVAAVAAAMGGRPAARWIIPATAGSGEPQLIARLLARGGPGVDAVLTAGTRPMLLEPPARAVLEAAAAAGCTSLARALQGARARQVAGGEPGGLV